VIGDVLQWIKFIWRMEGGVILPQESDMGRAQNNGRAVDAPYEEFAFGLRHQIFKMAV
jgi:hypothetical protein